MKRFVGGLAILLGLSCFASAANDRPAVELLLPGGTLYSLSARTYRSLRLPEGWSVIGGSFSPDDRQLALLLSGQKIPPKTKSDSSRAKTKSKAAALQEGPLNAAIRPWGDSTRLVIIDRATGAVSRSSRLAGANTSTEWTIVWGSGSFATAVPHAPAASVIDTGDCPRTLAETQVHEQKERFVREAGKCSLPPEKSDFYRLVRDNERTHRDAILWEYRVAVDTTTCSESYACYSGNDVQFLQTGERRFLVWDGDLYSVIENEDGAEVKLLSQLLPQFRHPWAIASGETRLGALDIVSKVDYQPVSTGLLLSHGENPTLYAQNFCPTRSFSASIEIGPYTKNLLTPAGYQVGPVDIGSFKDRAYTPVLISATWTAFHHIVDPVLCKLPYTIAPHTKGIIVSLTENDDGALQCHIQTQE